MSLFDGIRRAFKSPPERAADVQRDVDEELSFHLAMREEKLRARGLDATVAAAEARRRFGDVSAVRSECMHEDTAQLRSAKLGDRLQDLVRDVRIAARSLRRAPGFAAGAATLLALGIGGTTSVFSIVNAVYFRPLPYPNADRLAIAHASFPDPACDRRCARTPTAAEVAEWRTHARSIEAIATTELRQGPVTVSSGSFVLEGAAVSSGFTTMLGLHAAIGRTLTPADYAADAASVMVLSHSAWQLDFGGDSAVVGRVATIEDVSYRIVGVMAPESELGPPLFSFNVHTAEYLVPQTAPPESIAQVIVLIRRNVAVSSAQVELATLLHNASGGDWQATVEPLRFALATRYRGSFTLLLAAAVVVLLITCMNVGGLLVARLNDRMPELATRAVLGAGRWQLVQQVLTETGIVAFSGAGAGVLLAFYGTRAARLIPADRLPFWTPIVMDARVVTLAIVLAVVGGLALSIAPVLALSPARMVNGLRDLVSAAPRRARARGIVVSAEVALSVVLFGVAGILVKQLVAAEQRDLGSAKRSVVFVSLLTRDATTDGPWADRMIAGLHALPRVKSVGVMGMPKRSTRSLAAQQARRDSAIRRPGPIRRSAVFVEGSVDPVPDFFFGIANVVTPDYFTSVGTPIIAGRAFNAADDAATGDVAIINASAARRAFPNQSAIGRRFKVEAGGTTTDWITVVGVAADQHPIALDAPVALPSRAEQYRPWRQVAATANTLSLRVDGDSYNVVPLVRSAMHAIDPSIPVAKVSAIEEWIDRQMWAARFTTDVLAAFAAFALVLACLGVYATMSYVVGRRRRELAIRVAIGATRHDVVSSVVRSALRMLTLGLGVGVVASLIVSRVLRSMLYRSDGVDLPVLAVAVTVILAAGYAAAYLPARRAARADPLTALRSE